MIRYLRKYQRTIFGVLVVAAAALAMGGFGMGRFIMGSRELRGAINVNDTEISYDEFHRQRREMENFYRSRFGQNYEQIMKMLHVDVNQAVVDQIIANTLLDQELNKLGFVPGAEEIGMFLQAKVFPGGIDPERFQSFLREQGLTSNEFMENVRSTLLRQQLIDLFKDASKAALPEVRAMVEREETKFDTAYVKFDPAAFLEKTGEPGDERLKSWYEDHATKYEMPERVSYEYAVIDARNFENSVNVFPEDVESYYTENASKFQLPDEVRIRVIKLNIPDGASDEKKSQLREKAQALEERANNGEDFAKLVSESSEDTTTKLIGGEMGWIKRGALGEEFDENVFSMQGTGVAVVEAPKTIMVVKVEEYKEKQLKPINEVRPEIEKEIRKREAPTYASEEANKLLAEIKKSSKTFSEFVAEKNLKVLPSGKQGPELLPKENDPDPALAGLTRKVLEMPTEEKQVVEMGERSVLVNVVSYHPVETPPFAEVRENVLRDIRQFDAEAKAEQEATKFAAALKDSKGAGLEGTAAKEGVKVEKAIDISAQNSKDPLFAQKEVRDALFAAPVEGKLTAPLKVQGKYYVFQLKSVKKPSGQDVDKKIAEKAETVREENGEILLQSLINRLKAEARIKVDPNLTMVEEE